MNLYTRVRSSLYAGIVGDALGVPAEPSFEHELSLCSVKNLLGYGRYDLPKGTWSDDSSMVLCTMESLCRGYDPEHLGATFCRWLFESHWTACGHVLDCGVTTFLALEELHSGASSVRECGQQTVDDNGNGSLMRILPAALYFHNLPIESFMEKIHEVTRITHAHPRSLTACGIYSVLIRELLMTDRNKMDAYCSALRQAADYYQQHEAFRSQLGHFDRVLSSDPESLLGGPVCSSGYVVDTLEASLWCFMRHESTSEILLSTINLGLETDTTSMAAGGLAGAHYGLAGVPREWIESLARRAEIDKLMDEFANAVFGHERR